MFNTICDAYIKSAIESTAFKIWFIEIVQIVPYF